VDVIKKKQMKFGNMAKMDNINTMNFNHVNEINGIHHNDAIQLDNMMGT